ncbi:hypothetical protein O9K51_02027 [Purpureocillium lavendulum]|uniref:Uncharacterized protein n=1 Tax=Purpureocillium lavendulum TaxID=1247861 RepID=A0AB34G6P2_9HYPO|nr:hypothetical protein O9K51_02027 [Purpureocillium lavendulum]
MKAVAVIVAMCAMALAAPAPAPAEDASLHKRGCAAGSWCDTSKGQCYITPTCPAGFCGSPYPSGQSC